ncbi:MAG: hypothetical protein Q7R57_07585, partial [Dehalococcoidales bacterium]|nr:hypothetical protein [Dehalococcoidales bacterium]
LLFQQGLPSGQRLTALRASAFALLGVDGYLQRFAGDSSAKRLRCTLAERLMEGFASQASSEWPWPEESITYSNASLPHALLVTGRGMGRDDMVETGLRALRSLVALQMVEGRFVPIGNDGWYRRGGKRARFDQQPIEADTMIGACIEAFRITDDRNWLDRATRSFRWFLGQNDLGVPLCDYATGECSDGLQPTGFNQNHGAESTLAWMHSLIQMQAIQAEGLLQGATGNLGTKQPGPAEVRA